MDFRASRLRPKMSAAANLKSAICNSLPRYILRYGSTRAVGLFSPRGQDRYARGVKVIARTPRGLEAAEVLAEATDEQAKMLETSGGGQIMREMSGEDFNELDHIRQREPAAFEACSK